MSVDVKKIGEIFKTKRKELNLSLKEVENATSIRVKHLEAIEEGKKDEFLSSVYLLGFMKQYASFIGIDSEKIVNDNPELFNQKQENQEFSYGIGTLEVRSTVGGGVKWFPTLAWAALSVFILIVAYYLAKYLDVI